VHVAQQHARAEGERIAVRAEHCVARAAAIERRSERFCFARRLQAHEAERAHHLRRL
jgi:hypothetical protein